MASPKVPDTVAAFRKVSTLVLLTLALLSSTALAQVSPTKQAGLILRILAFDRKLPARANRAVRIGVVFKEGDSGSEAVMNELANALDAATAKYAVAGLPVKAARIPYTNLSKLEGELQRNELSAIYICPSLEDAVEGITRFTRTHPALTFTGTESYVKSGASVALVERSGKATILVHLTNSRAEGADLDSALLRLAEVIR